jgi:hypothetical protein
MYSIPHLGLVLSTMGISHGLALLPTDEAEVTTFPGMRQLPTGMDVTSCLRLQWVQWVDSWFL